MEFDVYAIKDLEKGSYAQPFFIPCEEDSVSKIKVNFKRLIEKGDSELSYFPERFELHCIGWFDDSGVDTFLLQDGVKVVAKGTDYARPEYLKALADAKKNMEDNEEKID